MAVFSFRLRENDMTIRAGLLALMFLGGPLVFAPPAEAQQTGLVFGFGLGPAVVSYRGSSTGPPFPDRATEFGVATDFHIGGVIGDSNELYFMSNVIFIQDARVGFGATGVIGVGFTYPLNPEFYISGGVGVGLWAEIDGAIFSNAAPPESYTGLGLVAGGGYRLSERWVLDFDVMYAKPGDDSLAITVVGAEISVNILNR